MSNTQQPEALSMATHLDSRGLYEEAAELRRLHAENEHLRSVMIAAAEEIHAHWDAHCNEEGYGPANLMRRLEEGIPASYGYKAGDFERLTKLNAELVEALKDFSDYVRNEQNSTDGAVVYSNTQIHRLVFKARAAISKATGDAT